ncbi:MAG: hypothetical protein HDT44_11715 [Ruminococcaceae bacterium]|nr:hypothetical protein [Oscillospiraceae bacterium]
MIREKGAQSSAIHDFEDDLESSLEGIFFARCVFKFRHLSDDLIDI